MGTLSNCREKLNMIIQRTLFNIAEILGVDPKELIDSKRTK